VVAVGVLAWAERDPQQSTVRLRLWRQNVATAQRLLPSHKAVVKVPTAAVDK